MLDTLNSKKSYKLQVKSAGNSGEQKYSKCLDSCFRRNDKGRVGCKGKFGGNYEEIQNAKFKVQNCGVAARRYYKGKPHPTIEPAFG
jgi:hypothetical protein